MTNIKTERTRMRTLVAVLITIAALTAVIARQGAATSSDQAQLVALCVGRIPDGHVDRISIVSSYALVGCVDQLVGTEFVATNSSGQWKVLFGGGGEFAASDLTSRGGIPVATANALVSGLAPPITPSPPTPTPYPTPKFTKDPCGGGGNAMRQRGAVPMIMHCGASPPGN